MNLINTAICAQHRKVYKEATDFLLENLSLKNDRVLEVKRNIYKVNPEIPTTTLTTFNHPFTIESEKGEHVTIVDTRPFEDVRKHDSGVISREVSALYNKALLIHEWEEDKGTYDVIGGVLSAVFADWLVSGIRQRYAPTELELLIIRFYLVIYYRMLTTPETRNVKDVYDLIERTILRDLKMPRSLYEEFRQHATFSSYIDGVAIGNSSFGFMLDCLTEHLDNVSLKFSPTAMIELIINGSWMGYANKEMVAAAVEFPPYLVYMSHLALEVGLYRRTRIGTAVNSLKQRKINVNMITRWVNELYQEN